MARLPMPVRAAALAALAALALAALPGRSQAAGDDLVFLSTQMRPVEEAQKLREVILKDYPGAVTFVPEFEGPFVTRVRAEEQGGKVTIGLLGGLHGDFPALAKEGLLEPLDDELAKLAGLGMPKAFTDLGRLGTDHVLYVPWMQATYVMAASKKALPYLPAGADLNALTYDQLKQWAEAVQKATGERKLGFPAGPKGLMHRLLQGYLYPSFTGGNITHFRGPEAEAAWTYLKALWASVSPRSTAYDFMQEPLLSGEVWIAMDHIARLGDALAQHPDDFVVFPAPAGPKGRGFMPVLAGLAIPKGAPNRAQALALIEHLTKPATELVTLRQVGFYPVDKVDLPADLPPQIRLMAAAIAAQSGAKDALPSLLPVGLGDKGGEFNKVFSDTFQRIVLRGQDIRQALDQEAGILRQIMVSTGAPCWAPDPVGTGPCPVP